MTGYPQLLHTVLDATDVRGLAEFYRQLLGLRYRPDSQPPTDGSPDDEDWLVLLNEDGSRCLAFQEVSELTPTTWPDNDVPMQLHLDFTVTSRDELERHRAHAEALGAHLVLDRSEDEDERLYVLADPAGHPFCLFVP